jgi:hypothetical protein
VPTIQIPNNSPTGQRPLVPAVPAFPTHALMPAATAILTAAIADTAKAMPAAIKKIS